MRSAFFPHFCAFSAFFGQKTQKAHFCAFLRIFLRIFLIFGEVAHFLCTLFSLCKGKMWGNFLERIFLCWVKKFDFSKTFQNVQPKIFLRSGHHAELKNTIFAGNGPTYPDFWFREAPVPRKSAFFSTFFAHFAHFLAHFLGGQKKRIPPWLLANFFLN